MSKTFSFNVTRRLLAGFAFAGIAACVLLFVPAVQDVIIAFAETAIVHRPLTHPVWHTRFIRWGASGVFVCCCVFVGAMFGGRPAVCRAARYVFPVFAALTFLRFLSFPVSTTGLDPSWNWALNNIAVSGKFVYGRDLTFTYGPLGYLFAARQYWPIIIQGIAFSVVCVTLLFAAFYFCYRKPEKARGRFPLFALLAAPVLGGLSLEWEWNITLLLLFYLCWLYRNDKKVFVPAGLLSGLLSAFSLFLKFNTAVLAGALAFVLGLCFLLFDRKKTFIYTALFALPYLTLTALGVVILFENAANFATWFRLSLSVASGFSAAMVVNGSVVFLAFAVIVNIMYCVFMHRTLRTDRDVFGLFALGAVTLFFAFKHGFVRQDGHMLSYFTTAPCLIGLILLFVPGAFYAEHLRWYKIIAVGSVFCVLSIGGLSLPARNIYQNITAIFRMRQNIATFEDRKAAAMRPDALPDEWNRVIADASIQILPWELAYAEANNWEGWRPNPALQLYGAYTKALDEYSAASFAEDRAPRFILLEYNAIDNRNMFLDTPATWNAVTCNYHIALRDEKRLLLERNSEYKTAEFVPFDSQTYTFGEPITVPRSSGPLYARVTIENSLIGNIITALFRGNPSTITVDYRDGNRETWRVIEDTLKNPVLVSSIPGSLEEAAGIFFGQEAPGGKVRTVTLSNKLRFLLLKKLIKVEWLERR